YCHLPALLRAHDPFRAVLEEARQAAGDRRVRRRGDGRRDGCDHRRRDRDRTALDHRLGHCGPGARRRRRAVALQEGPGAGHRAGGCSGRPPGAPVVDPRMTWKGSAMKWITRERPKIDRIACPWLIARFIDESPEFLYVPVELVMDVAGETGAVPYDVPGVELTHAGELCSFDAFLKKYKLKEPALQRLALIVRGADTLRLKLTPQSA